MSLDSVIRAVDHYHCSLVEITGGEPLLQDASGRLVKRLLDDGHTVLVETNGTLDIRAIDERATRIVDIKCPASGASDRVLFDNLDCLSHGDEVKFVISDRLDYEWACEISSRYSLPDRVPVLFSPVHKRLEPGRLARWMLSDRAPARLQLQLHKYLTGSGGHIK